jgi:hypothetical protein
MRPEKVPELVSTSDREDKVRYPARKRCAKDVRDITIPHAVTKIIVPASFPASLRDINI